MKYFCAVLLLCTQIVPVSVTAESQSDPRTTYTPPGHPVISEVLLGTEATGTQEFVELYNPTDQRIQFDQDWILQKAASGDKEEDNPDWQREIELPGLIEPGGFYLIASENWYAEEGVRSAPDVPAYWDVTRGQIDALLDFGMSDSGGHIRLLRPIAEMTDEEGKSKELDRLGWGDAIAPEQRSVPSPAAGVSLGRMFDELGYIVDTDDNVADFCTLSPPGPVATLEPDVVDEMTGVSETPRGSEGCLAISEDESPDTDGQDEPSDSGDQGGDHDQEEDSDSSDRSNQEESQDESGDSDEEQTEGGADSGQNDNEETNQEDNQADESESDTRVYPDVVVTEVLPDPEAPATDAQDEFVELYNPTSAAIKLGGYVVQTGSDLGYTFEIPNITIAPNEYQVFYARNASITLTNSGGRVQVLDPKQNVASNLVTYSDVPPGDSWAKVNGLFLWSDRTTPGRGNMPPTPEPQEVQPPDDPATESVTEERIRQTYADLRITEVLPDPDSPLTDAEDEFVELYNPNDTAVALEGYIVDTGSDFSSSHELTGTIAPHAYTAVFSDNASISLVNSGGAVRLVGENGKIIDTITPYPAAETGSSWAVAAGEWQWTTRTTPAAANQLARPDDTDEDTQGDIASATNETNVSGEDEALGNITQPATIETSPYTTASVVISIALALLYALYEFRYDIRNRIEITRRYIAHWRADRS